LIKITIEMTISELKRKIELGEKPDEVFVDAIHIKAIVGLNSWQKVKSQDVVVTAVIYKDIESAATGDNFEHALDYRKIYGPIQELNGGRWGSHVLLFCKVVQTLRDSTQAQGGRVEIHLPKSLLRCEGGVKASCSFYRLDAQEHNQSLAEYFIVPGPIQLHDIRLSCIIGINDVERVKKQPISFSFTAHGIARPGTADYSGPSYSMENLVDLPSIFDGLINAVEVSSYLTVEALAKWIADEVLKKGFWEVEVQVKKLSVFGYADGPGVRISRKETSDSKDRTWPDWFTASSKGSDDFLN